MGTRTQSPGICWLNPPRPRSQTLASWVRLRTAPPSYTCVLLTAVSFLPPAQGGTLNSGKGRCPCVHLSVQPLACDHGSAHRAPAMAGAELKRVLRGEVFPSWEGGRGADPVQPRPAPEPSWSPAGARPQPQPEPAPAEPERRTPRPGGPGALAGESRGNRAQGKFWAPGVEPQAYSSGPAPCPPASWKFGAGKSSCQGSQECGPRRKEWAGKLGDLL